MLIPFLAAFTVIALAELGDKTQLLTLGLAARYPFWKVIGGVFCAIGVLNAAAVIGGVFLNKYIPLHLVQFLSGLLFIGFGVWSYFDQESDPKTKEDRPGGGAFKIIFFSFLLAELGDKTQLAALVLAAKYGSPLQIWLGATGGMFLVNIASVLIGGALKKYLPEKVLKIIAAIVFIAFGILTLTELFLH